jgi:hypothetical protein
MAALLQRGRLILFVLLATISFLSIEARMRKIIILLLVLALPGCMSTSAQSYKPLTQASHFVFSQDVMIKNKLSSGLAKGSYQAAFESESHVYYLGEAKSLILNDTLRINGGIALPKPSSNIGCHLFLQVGDDSEYLRTQGMGVLIVQLAKLEEGNIREFKNDPECHKFMPLIELIND